jgi:hypothetical protein
MHRQGRSAPWTLLSLSAMLTLIFLLAACGDNTSGTPSAQELIQKSQQAIQKVKSYHFTLDTENPGQNGTISVKSADGDILVPDKLQAKAGATISGFSVSTEVIAIGADQYLKNPLTNKWEKTDNLIDPRLITSSDTGIAALLGSIQNPSTPQDSSVDGTACWSISGKIDTKYIGSITGMSGLSGQTVDTTVCIGKSDNLPYQIVITGKAIDGDKTDTKRTFKLSKFDEQLNIQAPAV